MSRSSRKRKNSGKRGNNAGPVKADKPQSDRPRATKSAFPASVTSFRINLLALACFLGCLLWLNQTAKFAGAETMLLVLASWAIPVIVLEALFLRKLPRINSESLNLGRSALKLFGFYATLLLFAGFYWMFDEYHGSFYRPFWDFLKLVGPWVLVGAIPYIYLVDSTMDKPEDGYYHFASYLLRRKGHCDNAVVWQHLLGWLVKAFFLPLMMVYFVGTCKFIINHPIENVFTSFRLFYDFSWELIFGIDLAIVCVGYLLTLKYFDSHIRSTEPTVGGWLCAIICYQPFWSLLSAGYLAYNKDNYSWGNWLGGNETAYMIWGSIILVLITIYSLSSVAFGIRFSNLTHRGILTNGPYRYSKHPAYISKNLSWWFIAIPFIAASSSGFEVVRSMALLLGLNLIYYARAKTEERHLSRDPVYLEYIEAIEKHGWIPRLRRFFQALIPGLKSASQG